MCMHHLTSLLEATAFQAHAAERRVITEEHLISAAIGLAAPHTLASITRPSYTGAPAVGHYVLVLRGAHAGCYGALQSDDGSDLPFHVHIDLPDGTTRAEWLARDDVQSTGMAGRSTFEARSRDLRRACI